MTISSLSSSSLMALLGTSSATSYDPSDISASTQSLLSALTGATNSSTGSTSSATSSAGVSISTDAKLAAADATDNAKDFSALATEVRQELDQGTTPMSEMSGRALASIVLNEGSNFSPTEIASAKQELNSRTRQDFSLAMNGSGGTSGLAAYDQQLVTQYDSMSDEEREARGWTQSMRDSAASFVSTSSQTSTTSLFDALDQNDSSDTTGLGF